MNFLNKNNTKQQITLIIPIIWVVIFFIIPIIILVINSFSLYKNGTIFSHFSLDNFIYIFQSKVFYKSVLNSLFIAFISSIICTVIALVFIVLVWKLNTKIKFFLISLSIIAFFSGFIPKTFALQQSLSEHGPLNKLISIISFDLASRPILYTPEANILVNAIMFTPLSIIILIPSRFSINENIIFSSKELGIRRFNFLRKILLPLMFPGMLISLLLTFIVVFGDTIIVDTIGGSSVYTSSLYITDFFKINDYGVSSAAALICLLISLLMVYVIIYLAKKVNRLSTFYE
jgi:ABC-type spermidine/putrescine transport system permease subunit I